jgi:hypothetical protein
MTAAEPGKEPTMKIIRSLSLLLALVAAPAVASAGHTQPAPAKSAPAKIIVAPKVMGRTAVVDHRAAKRTDAERQAARIQRVNAMFKRLDVNHNGTLSKREVRGTRLADRFAALDTNRNGALSRGEVIQGMGKGKRDGKGWSRKGKGKGDGKGWSRKGKGQGRRG